MKLITALTIAIMCLSAAVGWSQDKPDPKLNELNYQLIQLQGQINLMDQQFIQSADRYVDDKRQRQAKMNELIKQIAQLQKQAEKKTETPIDDK